MDRKIKITWSGEQATITPTCELMDDIENIIDVPSFVMGMLSQRAKMGDCVKIITAVLNHGGIDVSKEDVYSEISEAELSQVLEIVMEMLKKTFPMFFQTPKKKPTSRKAKA